MGETYVQLPQVTQPKENVAAASPQDPRATQGFNAGIERQPPLDNPTSAIPLDGR